MFKKNIMSQEDLLKSTIIVLIFVYMPMLTTRVQLRACHRLPGVMVSN